MCGIVNGMAGSIYKQFAPRANAMRAPGEAPGMMALEIAMDEMAEKLGMDPVEFRIRNDTQVDPEHPERPFSQRQFVECLRQGAERFGWNRRQATGTVRDGRWLVGMGMAAGFRNAPVMKSGARARLDAGGRVTIETDMTDIGTGSYTIIAQTAAEMMGVPAEAVAILSPHQALDRDWDTVVIAGHGAGVHPNLAGLPTVAEPTAPAAANPLHPLALPLLRPAQVIMLGRPTLHRTVSALLADPAVPVFALTTGPRWPDVSGNSQATGTRAVTTGTPDPQWLQRADDLHRRTLEAVRAQLAQHPHTTGLHVAAAVTAGLRDGDQLVLGASNPVRDIALAGFNQPGVKVRSNRGVAGIDGTISTAIGAALAHERSGSGTAPLKTVALVGDLTFVHDSSGLLIGPTEPVPRNLTIVVSNDNGGGIFELLEQGDPRFSDVSSRVFGTPHDVDIAALCQAYHVPNRQVDVDSLTEVLAEPVEGMRVLEVKADRTSLRALHASIRAALQ